MNKLINSMDKDTKGVMELLAKHFGKSKAFHYQKHDKTVDIVKTRDGKLTNRKKNERNK